MPDDIQVIDQDVQVNGPDVQVDTVETTPVEETPPERTGPSVKEFISGLTGKAREIYRLHGLKAARAYVAKKEGIETPGASTEAQIAPDSGSGTTEQTPKPNRQDRNFRTLSKAKDDLERELIAARAKLELYERDRAASGPSAPAASKETKPAVADDPRPKMPKLGTFKGTGEEYDTAMEEWHKLDTEWLLRNSDKRIQGERQRTEHAQATQAWNTQIEKAREVHADYDTVVFNDSTPISYTTIGVIQSLTDGALRSYALAKNLPEATRIAEATLIPGENQFKSFGEFLAWIKSSPDRAMLYGEKMAVAKAELAKLTAGKPSAPKAQPKPLKEVIASTRRPSAEVDTDGNAGPVLDERAHALKTHNQRAYREIMNRRDLAKRNGR